MAPPVCYSHLYSESGDEKDHTWSAPGELQAWAEESQLDPPRTDEVRQEGGVSDETAQHKQESGEPARTCCRVAAQSSMAM